MRTAVESQAITIMPDRFEKIYYNWIDNLHDWCISRQIWFGHRIPVWYRDNETSVGTTAPEGEGWAQDPDTLDTWFSSGLWTFSTLGWPNTTEDMRVYHPTDILETGYDLIFFWIARMILMSSCLLGNVPFKTVYMHGLIRDEKGRKMSKSLGNIVNPLDKITQFGADALRMAFIVGNPPGADANLSDSKIKGYKHFANKVWNVTRFIETHTEGYEKKETTLTARDQAILEELAAVKERIASLLDEYKLYLAAEELYHYVWDTVADTIIEEMKQRTSEDAAKYVLHTLLREILIMLHPFMPFVTEEIWQTLGDTEGLLMTTRWK